MAFQLLPIASLSGLLNRFRGDIVYALNSALTSVIALLGSIVATRYLKPEEMGVMQTLLLIPVYCSFLHFGVFNGLSRDVALNLGKNDLAKVQMIVDTSWWVAKRVALAGIFISTAIAVGFWSSRLPELYLLGMTFVTVQLATEPLSQHLELVYLSSRNFRGLGRRLLCQNVIMLLANALPAIGGAIGFIAARATYGIARLAVRWRGVPFPATNLAIQRDVIGLASVGFPILIAGTLHSYLAVADRSVVALLLTRKEVGYYALAGLVVAGVQFLPSCLATLLYPRVAACYGRTGSSRSLRPYLWLLLGVNTVALWPTCVAGYLLVGPLTERFLPAYTEGISAAKLSCLSSMTLVYFAPTCVIAVLRRNYIYIAAMGVALLAVWVLGYNFANHEHGLLGAIAAKAIASSALCIFVIGYAFWLTGREVKS